MLRPLKALVWPLKAPGPDCTPAWVLRTARGGPEIPTPCKFCCAAGVCWVLFICYETEEKKKNRINSFRSKSHWSLAGFLWFSFLLYFSWIERSFPN